MGTMHTRTMPTITAAVLALTVPVNAATQPEQNRDSAQTNRTSPDSKPKTALFSTPEDYVTTQMDATRSLRPSSRTESTSATNWEAEQIDWPACLVATHSCYELEPRYCVIRGETPHFDYVCQEASLGLGAVARQSDIPVVFGVLTTDDEAQARARAGAGRENKGYEAAMAALEMVEVYRTMDGSA